MLLWLFDIFQQPRKKETSMYAGLTQKASRAFPEFCFMELQIWVQSTDNQATASKKTVVYFTLHSCTVNGNSRRLPRSAAITYGTALTEIIRQSHFWCLNLKSQSLRISRSQHWLWQTDASRCCDYTNKPWFIKTVPWNHVWHPQTKSQCLRILQSQHPSCCAVAIPSERSLILKVQRKCSDNYLSYRIYSQINPPVHSFKLRKKSNCSAPRNSCSISLLNLHCEHFYGSKLTTFQSFRKWSVPMYST